MSARWSEQDEYDLVGLARREAQLQALDADLRRRTLIGYYVSFFKSGNPYPSDPATNGITQADIEAAAAEGRPLTGEGEGRAWAMRQIARKRRLAAPASAPVDTSVDTSGTAC